MTDRYMSDHKDRMEASEIFETPEASGFSKVTQHSEVEGLVEEFRAKFYKIEAVWIEEKKAYEYPISEMMDWLRTALTTHGAKEREAGYKQGFHIAETILHMDYDDAMQYLNENHPQTDATKN